MPPPSSVPGPPLPFLPPSSSFFFLDPRNQGRDGFVATVREVPSRGSGLPKRVMRSAGQSENRTMRQIINPLARPPRRRNLGGDAIYPNDPEPSGAGRHRTRVVALTVLSAGCSLAWGVDGDRWGSVGTPSEPPRLVRTEDSRIGRVTARSLSIPATLWPSPRVMIPLGMPWWCGCLA